MAAALGRFVPTCPDAEQIDKETITVRGSNTTSLFIIVKKLADRNNTEFTFIREAITDLPQIDRGDRDRVASREISAK